MTRAAVGRRSSARTSRWSGWPAIVWLYLGPPVFRFSERSAQASIDGSVDAAILLRVMWWVTFGALSLIGIVRMWRHLLRLARERPSWLAVSGVYVLAILVSSLFSPSPLFSLVNGGMMVILVLASLELALLLRSGRWTVRGVITALCGASWLVLGVMLLVLAVLPELVAAPAPGGIRLRGGEIGDPTVLASVAVVAGVYLAATTRAGIRYLYAASVAPAFTLLLIARSRTAYVALLVALVFWFVVWLVRARSQNALRGLSVVALTLALGLAFSMGSTLVGGGAAVEKVGSYLTRDLEGASSLSGRTVVFRILLRALPAKPLGLGYAAGPRELLLSSDRELERNGIVPDRIGNAHNAYIEMLVGAGPIGGLFFVMLVMMTASALARVGVRGSGRRGETLAVAALVGLTALLAVQGLTGSDAALPFRQASALLWILVGVAWGASPAPKTHRDALRAHPPRRERFLRGGRALHTVAIAATLLGVGAVAVAQQEPAGNAVEIHVAIDDDNASDANPGTIDAPLATLNAALDRALVNRRSGVPTRVRVHPGTYRESLVGRYLDDFGATITFEAVNPGTAIVAGTDRFEDWTCEATHCTHAWPHTWGVDENPWPNEVRIGELARRREIVLVDGVNLDQVAARDDLMPGSFFVDERAGTLVLMPPLDVDLRIATVEVGVRPTLMRLQGLNDLIIRGMVFTGAASPFRHAALDVVDQRNVTLDDVRVIWNGQVGLSLKGRNIVVRGARLDRNGSSGITAFQVADVEILDTEVSFNNWRGPRGDYETWEVGNKFTSAHRVRFDGFRSFSNASRGLWLDADIADVEVTRAYLCDNRRDGLFLEAMQGPVLVSDSMVCQNGASGILTSASQNVELVGNMLVNNEHGQLMISGQLEREVIDWETRNRQMVRSQSWLLMGNVLFGSGRQMLVTSTLPSRVWTNLMSSSLLTGNLYIQPNLRYAFEGPAGIPLDYPGWRSLSGEGATSSFSDREERLP